MRCREFNAAAKRAPNARSCRVCCREQVAGGVPCCCSFLTFCSLDICRLAVHTALIEFNVFTVVEQLNLQPPPRSNWLIVLSSTFLFFSTLHYRTLPSVLQPKPSREGAVTGDHLSEPAAMAPDAPNCSTVGYFYMVAPTHC